MLYILSWLYHVLVLGRKPCRHEYSDFYMHKAWTDRYSFRMGWPYMYVFVLQRRCTHANCHHFDEVLITAPFMSLDREHVISNGRAFAMYEMSVRNSKNHANKKV